jgi:hypothetical protein
MVLAIALLGGAFALSGYAMAGSFLEAGAAPEPRLRLMARVYLTACTVCVVAALAALGRLLRTRKAAHRDAAI